MFGTVGAFAAILLLVTLFLPALVGRMLVHGEFQELGRFVPRWAIRVALGDLTAKGSSAERLAALKAMEGSPKGFEGFKTQVIECLTSDLSLTPYACSLYIEGKISAAGVNREFASEIANDSAANKAQRVVCKVALHKLLENDNLR
jgi:hypothetical protein